MKPIQSRDNPTFKHLRALAENGRYRRSEGATLLDGVHLLQAAQRASVQFKRIALTAKASQLSEISALLASLPAGCELIELPEALLRVLSPVETPSGIVAEIMVPTTDASASDTSGDLLLLEAVQDAGNLGTLLRTAAAAGVRRVLLSEQCAHAWSPKVLRAGMGAHFGLQIVEQCALDEALNAWSGEVIATALDPRAQNLFALNLRAPTAWLFGSEGRGLSAALRERATVLAQIPMPGGTESLNVAAAAAVCLFEQLRQRAV